MNSVFVARSEQIRPVDGYTAKVWYRDCPSVYGAVPGDIIDAESDKGVSSYLVVGLAPDGVLVIRS